METKKVEKLEPGMSYQVKLEEKDSFIIVNGVVIHEGVIYELEMLQRDDQDTDSFGNDGYRSVAAIFGELLSYIAYSAEYTNEDEKVLELLQYLYFHLNTMKNLSLSRKMMQKLSKPIQNSQ